MNVLCVPKVDLASCRGQRRACRWRVIVGVGAVSEACGSDDNYSQAFSPGPYLCGSGDSLEVHLLF
jgi:hypothetical protein